MFCAQTMLVRCSSSAVVVLLACVACMLQGCFRLGSHHHARVICQRIVNHGRFQQVKFTCDDRGRCTARCRHGNPCTPACRDTERQCFARFGALPQLAEQRISHSTNVTHNVKAASETTERVDSVMQEAGAKEPKLPLLKRVRIRSHGPAAPLPKQLKLRAEQS